MPYLSETVDSYMFSDEVASLSTSTRRRTRTVLNDLIKVAGPKLKPSSLSRSHVDRTVAMWRARGLTENSINNYKNLCRHFTSWLFETRLNRADVGGHLKTVKTSVDYSKRQPLTAEELRRVIKVADVFSDRDGCCLRLMAYTGLRESEVVRLRWRDVDLDAGLIHAYRPKTRDHHVVPVPTALAEALTLWRARYVARCGPIRPDWVVVPAFAPQIGVQSHARRLDPTKVQTNLGERVKLFLKISGVENLAGRRSHAIRRTSATMLLDSGATVGDVRQLLGHASEAQSMAYISRDLARERLAERMKDFRI